MSEESRNHRKVYQGRVVSDKMDKTITVVVETYKTHPEYGKRVRYSKKYYAQDDNNTRRRIKPRRRFRPNRFKSPTTDVFGKYDVI